MRCVYHASMPNSRDLVASVVVILLASFSTARSDSLLESSIKSASSINCRPWGNKATETIKIGDEVLKIPLKFVVILSPCSTAFEHTHIALSGLPEFEGQLISLSSLNPSAPPASMIRLDNDYLDRIDRSALPSVTMT